MRKVVAIIESRMNSTRLPGKVLLPLAGKPVLSHVVERLKRATLVDQIVIATTDTHSDNAIVEHARGLKVGSFRGSEHDVLARVHGAAQMTDADVIVQITGDCPLIDPHIVDQLVDTFQKNDTEFVSNLFVPGYPLGVDLNVFSRAALNEAHLSSPSPEEREHTALYMWNHREKFRCINMLPPQELHWPTLRLLLDEQADFDFLSVLIEYIQSTDPFMNTVDILTYLRSHPELVAINAHVKETVVT